MTDQVLLQVVARIQDADVHLLPEAVAAGLAEAGARETVIWLADHQQSHLLAVPQRPDLRALPIEGTAVGRVYASQRPQGNAEVAIVPISHRGARRGVLAVTDSPLPVGLLQRVAEFLSLSLHHADAVTDRYIIASRLQRLTVAAEMQWAALPGRSYRETALAVAGVLEPAYMVVGDAFDWSRLDDRLQVSVLEGNGQGTVASLATALALNAVRNARRAGLDLVDQAHLTDQAVYSHYGGKQHIAALMFEVHVPDGRVELVDAGSPRLMRMSASGALEDVVLEAQLPLGMFEDTPYKTQAAQLDPGDRLFALSQGVGSTVSPNGRPFTGDTLAGAIRRTRLLPPAEAARFVIRALGEHRDHPEPQHDAVVVCLDWQPSLPTAP